MKKGQLRQLVLSLGGGIAVFLVLALALRWNFLFSAALGVGIYLGLWFLLTPRRTPSPSISPSDRTAARCRP